MNNIQEGAPFSPEQVLREMAASLEACMKTSYENPSLHEAKKDAEDHIIHFAECAKRLEQFIIAKQNAPEYKPIDQKISELREEIQRKDALLDKFSSFFNERLQTFEELQARQKYLLYDSAVLSEIQSASASAAAELSEKKTPVSADYSNAFSDAMQVDDGVLGLADQ